MRTTRLVSRQVLRVATRGLALPPHTVVGLPALSPTMTQGNIASYVAKIGDQLTTGDRLAEIETDKATVDFEATDDGFLAQILIPAGTLVSGMKKYDQPLCRAWQPKSRRICV
ncbi:dihydrolipoamide acetyltransferase component [Chrysochromulina tobinii]|uniref:Dihydrolipoamide acetyltransferase component n=1 Tax=Chrysochromulina tobinii TaxID=1460289 RepID=A0A0M0LS94_9EUKA|nr:dihydrolipoamide acetyltransferase component [Chrysochromulina tobinii]|eukprot:KOO53915.1 dihydrolipoamide acetyltransferase component [Chrysochromulina sp. CCMP291]